MPQRNKSTPRWPTLRSLGHIFLHHGKGRCAVTKKQSAPTQTTNPLKRGGMRLMMLALIVLTVSLLINFVRQVVQSARLEAQRVALAHEVSELEAEVHYLEGAVAYTSSDAYVERVAREHFAYAYEDDVVVMPQFVEVTPVPSPTASVLEPLPVHTEPNWETWWKALFVQ